MLFEFGDVVLVPFPFTNHVTSKKAAGCHRQQPKPQRRQADVVVMAITGQLRASPGRGDVRVEQWQAAGLIKPSAIKPIFATLEQALVLRQLGTLGAGDRAALRKSVGEMLG